jgi:hypothetical protein
MLCLIARPSRLVSDFDSQLDSDHWSCVLRASIPAHDPAQPDPTQPGPAWRDPACPWRPTPHVRPLSISLSHFIFPRSNSLSLSLSSTSLSPLFALGDPVDGYRRFLDPKMCSPLLSLSLPPSLYLSLSLSLSLPFLFPCVSLLLPHARARPSWPPAARPSQPLARGRPGPWRHDVPVPRA